MYDHIRKFPHAQLHEPQPHVRREKAPILAQDEQVDRLIPLRRLFDEVPVPQREGIGVHDDRRGWARPFRSGKRLAEACKAPLPVFHENERPVQPRDLRKAEALKKADALRFGVDKKMVIPARRLHLHEMRDDLVQKSLALMVLPHGKAAERGGEAAAGRKQGIILVKQPAGVVQMRVRR